MQLTSRAHYVDIVQHQYFGAMARGRTDQILPLLADTAVLTGFYGSSAPRIVRRRPAAGEESFETFLGGLQADFDLTYSSFEHVVDLAQERCACTFQLEIVPRNAGSAAGARKFRNCNFFQFEDGLITMVTAYFANPPGEINPWHR